MAEKFNHYKWLRESTLNEVKVNYNFSEDELKRVLKLLGRNASTEVKMIKAFEKALGRKLTRDELFESLNEDGHTDVPSAKRKLKLAIEDCQDLLKQLESTDGEASLPSWWTSKITLAADYLNKCRDYLLNKEE